MCQHPDSYEQDAYAQLNEREVLADEKISKLEERVTFLEELLVQIMLATGQIIEDCDENEQASKQ
jgi:hypothetical protein